jgi:hypothetical protein
MTDNFTDPYREAEAGMIEMLQEAMDEAVRSGGNKVEVSYAYVTFDPETLLPVEDEKGKIVVGDDHYFGELLGVTATAFTVAVTHTESYPDDDEEHNVEADVKALLEGALELAVTERKLPFPEIRTIEVHDICDLIITSVPADD